MTYPPSKSAEARRRAHLKGVGNALGDALVVQAVTLQLIEQLLVGFVGSVQFFRGMTVSDFCLGCWPIWANTSNSSSTLVRLKFPATTRLRVRQLFWRKNGWQFSISFLPNVP